LLFKNFGSGIEKNVYSPAKFEDLKRKSSIEQFNYEKEIFSLWQAAARLRRSKQEKIKARESTIKRAKAEGEMKLRWRRSLLEYNSWVKQASRKKLLEKTEIK
jgi:hypothetical protein